jgi:hypothetical protein
MAGALEREIASTAFTASTASTAATAQYERLARKTVRCHNLSCHDWSGMLLGTTTNDAVARTNEGKRDAALSKPCQRKARSHKGVTLAPLFHLLPNRETTWF